jgi:hypothetical protein
MFGGLSSALAAVILIKPSLECRAILRSPASSSNLSVGEYTVCVCQVLPHTGLTVVGITLKRRRDRYDQLPAFRISGWRPRLRV